MRILLKCLGTASALALAAPVNAAWYEAKSRHFIIYADENPNRLQGFAERLERFDQAVRRLRDMDDPPLTDSNRLRVYVMKSEGAVSRLIGDSMALGMYEPRVSGAVAFVPRYAGSALNDWDLDTEAIFFHEYAHHLQLQYASVALPTWVVEGFAEFYATAEVKKNGDVLIGKFPKYRLYSFYDDGGLTLEQMVGGTYSRLTPVQVNALYGRGWFLMDYLTFAANRQGQLTKYIEGIQSGMTPLDSARTAFGDLKQLKRDIDRYGKGDLTGFNVAANVLSTGPITLRPLGPGEAAIMPVHIRSTRGVTDKTAPAVAADARKAAAPYPNDPFVQSALAEAEFDAGNLIAAEAAADRALAANPNQVHALIYKGRVQMELAKAKPEGADWEKVRSWFIKANKVDTENAEPLAFFYRTYVAAGQKPTKNALDALMYAVVLAPQDDGLRLLATRQLLLDNDAKGARAMLAPLAYKPHSSNEFRDAMTQIMTVMSTGDSKAALKLLDKGPEREPDKAPKR